MICDATCSCATQNKLNCTSSDVGYLTLLLHLFFPTFAFVFLIQYFLPSVFDPIFFGSVRGNVAKEGESVEFFAREE